MILCFGSVNQYQEASARRMYLSSESLYCLRHHIHVYLLPFNADQCRVHYRNLFMSLTIQFRSLFSFTTKYEICVKQMHYCIKRLWDSLVIFMTTILSREDIICNNFSFWIF